MRTTVNMVVKYPGICKILHVILMMQQLKNILVVNTHSKHVNYSRYKCIISNSHGEEGRSIHVPMQTPNPGLRHYLMHVSRQCLGGSYVYFVDNLSS